MEYKVHPGIVLLNICDTHMLVATRQFWEEFPRVRPLPHLWSICWTLMEKGYTDRQAVGIFARLFRIPEDEVNRRFAKMFSTLSQEGYLIPAEDEK